MKKHLVLVVFVAVQVLGLACAWFWHHPYSSGSSFLWGVGFFALLPGNILGGWLVEKLFWQSHLPTDLLMIVALVLINAIVWFVAIKGLKVLYAYFSRRSAVPGANAAK